MDRRRKVIANGKCYLGIEILYKLKDKIHSKNAVCIACYVTLPKKYKLIASEYADIKEFTKKDFGGIIYSFLIIPVRNANEAKVILKSLEKSKSFIVV